MNARLFGSSPCPRASPNSGGLLEFYPPQNWLARGAKSYPNSATPIIIIFDPEIILQVLNIHLTLTIFVNQTIRNILFSRLVLFMNG